MVFVLEVLGLGMGVAPLIIEFLKANPEAIDAAKTMRPEAAKAMMDAFYTDLGFEMSMLHITLANLVRELPIEEDLKLSLINPTNLDAAIWKNPPPLLQSSLENRLSPCLETFQNCMGKILHQLTKLVREKSLLVPLPQDPIGADTGKSYAKLEDLFRSGVPASRRLKFGFNKNKLDKLIGNISKYNHKLQQMLDRTSSYVPIEVPRQRKQETGCVPHLGLRQRMTELCQAMGRAWCKCTGRHELRFGLSKAEIDEAHITLDMLMNLSKDHQKYQWGESKMKIRLQNETPSPKPVDPSLPLRRSTIESRRRSSAFSGSAFVESPESSPRTESPRMPLRLGSPLSPIQAQTNSSQPKSAPDPSKRPPGVSQVDVVCQAVSHGHRKRRASQITFEDDELWCHPTLTDAGVTHNDPGVSLTEYLLARKLTLEDCKVLQVLLAQSILFFPWKGADLSKDSIAFHHTPPRKPFASLQTPDGSEESPGRSPQIFPEADDINPGFYPYQNETLVALGTVLLELEMRKRIEDMTIDDDIAEDDPSGFLTRFWTTSRVLDEQKPNIYHGCFDAINACIRCDFAEDSASLDDTTFLEKVYEHIVLPLEAELLHGFNMKLPIVEAAALTAQQPVRTRTSERTVQVSQVPNLSMRPLPLRSMADSGVAFVIGRGTSPGQQVRVDVEVETPETSPATSNPTSPRPL